MRRSTMWGLRHRPASDVTGTSHELQPQLQWRMWIWSHGDSRSRYVVVPLTMGSVIPPFCQMATKGHLTEMTVYGEDVTIIKECVNHVAERMGTALRKLAAHTKKTGVTLGSHAHGKLIGARSISWPCTTTGRSDCTLTT